MWSPALDKAHEHLQYWKQRRLAFDDAHKTKALLAKSIDLEIEDYGEKSLAAVISHSHKAEQQLFKVQNQDREYRVQYLLNMAEKYAMENDLSKETAIRELLCHEELRDTFRTIREQMGTMRSPQMTEVWIQPTHGSEKIILDNSSVVEPHLLARNREKLRDAHGTPFAGGTLSQYLDDSGNSDFAYRVLQGNYLPELNDVHPTIKSYVESLAFDNLAGPDSVNVELTPEQYRNFWKKKEGNHGYFPIRITHWALQIQSR